MAESPVDQLREMSMIHPRIGGAPQYLGNGPLPNPGSTTRTMQTTASSRRTPPGQLGSCGVFRRRASSW
jgi:hypothetical protein